MGNNQLNSPMSSGGGQGKAKKRSTQIQTIFYYLSGNVATASMVSEATGIPQKNICRYKRDLERSGMLWEVRKERCLLTGFKAWFLTTNPDLAPKRNSQLNLFGDEH
ncbi:hypothetical protein GCM10023091_23610 [Ravibacter arvi]|uniref:Uncharacterized protein n=1 Tax=Ravibacter arvi TaxID=2051041 RepID=A0ABP8M135_9BACT